MSVGSVKDMAVERIKNLKYTLPRSPFHLKVTQWNARSVNSEDKIKYIKGLQSDIVAVQEIWQKGNNIKNNFQTIDLVERPIGRGGGTALIVENLPDYRVQKAFRVNKDTNMIRVNFKNNYIW